MLIGKVMRDKEFFDEIIKNDKLLDSLNNLNSVQNISNYFKKNVEMKEKHGDQIIKLFWSLISKLCEYSDSPDIVSLYFS